MSEIQCVCVYCGSSPGKDGRYVEAGRRLGQAIAERGLRLVYGGGARGIMGAVAEGAIGAGGKVTGIIPRFLIRKEASEAGLDRLDDVIVTEDLHERKQRMFAESDAFVALPGGIGTLEEIIEIMTWAQLGRHAKPVLLANLGGFWNPLLALLEHMSDEGFIHTQDRVRPLVAETVEAIVPMILAAAKAADLEGDAALIRRL